MKAVSRDSMGDFVVCRCSGSQMTLCCQLVLRASTHRPEAKGGCASCGQSGDCGMAIYPSKYKAECKLGDVGRS
jgi:hypothetical protein